MTVRRPAPAKSVAASFDRAAPTYLEHAEVQAAMAAWLAEWLPADRQGRALEIGSGPAVFTPQLLPWDGSVTASDVSPAMCAEGKKRLPAAVWKVMSAEAPADGPWDWIFSSSILQWTEDPRTVFSAWRERLAPGGRILSGLFAKGSLVEWDHLAEGEAPLAWRSPEEWRSQLKAVGLHLARDASMTRVFTHSSAHSFLKSLHRLGAAPAPKFGPGRLRRLLREYQIRHAVPGGVSATWVFYRFEAHH